MCPVERNLFFEFVGRMRKEYCHGRKDLLDFSVSQLSMDMVEGQRLILWDSMEGLDTGGKPQPIFAIQRSAFIIHENIIAIWNQDESIPAFDLAKRSLGTCRRLHRRHSRVALGWESVDHKLEQAEDMHTTVTVEVDQHCSYIVLLETGMGKQLPEQAFGMRKKVLVCRKLELVPGKPLDR